MDEDNPNKAQSRPESDNIPTPKGNIASRDCRINGLSHQGIVASRDCRIKVLS